MNKVSSNVYFISTKQEETKATPGTHAMQDFSTYTLHPNFTSWVLNNMILKSF